MNVRGRGFVVFGAQRAGLLAAMLATAALTAGAPLASAQEKWPSRRVTIVVPFGPGTVTDATARLIADQLRESLAQPFIVENRAGAGGTLAASTVAKSAPDGYTLLFGGNTTHSAAPSLFKNVPYDPLKDFTPIARIGRFFSVMATNPQQPFKTVEEFVVYARANPGKLTCGHGNSTGHITCETVKRKLGLDIVRLPYSSNPPALTDLLGNSIQLMVPDFLTGGALMDAGKIIGLAAVTRDRSPLMADVRTFHETVIKDFEIAPWVGVFGPAGLTADTAQQVSDALAAIIAKPDISKRLSGMGTEPWHLPIATFAAFVAADVPVWAAHAKIAGIEPQ